jgi:DNA-binding NtrC family response regulator
LIADDDEYLRDTLAELLADSGYGLLFSGTAKETWEAIDEKRPDLVLLDIRFPDCQDLSCSSESVSRRPRPRSL